MIKKKKIKRINNAGLFSEPYSIIFPKGANNTDHECIHYTLYITDPRLLGALGKLCWGVDEMHLSVFHSASNRSHGERSGNSVSSTTRKNSSL